MTSAELKPEQHVPSLKEAYLLTAEGNAPVIP